ESNLPFRVDLFDWSELPDRRPYEKKISPRPKSIWKLRYQVILHHGRVTLHIAIATAHGIEYLLTWNCTHIANAIMRPRIEQACRDCGYEPPIICTPQELMEA
ncbi:MAG TPA: hypothetical protein PKC25_07285, partial [Candidatus Rifleibacterium sp.]|nr:hypothetical protein [Candidatus Rifleibacterium sp.]